MMFVCPFIPVLCPHLASVYMEKQQEDAGKMIMIFFSNKEKKVSPIVNLVLISFIFPLKKRITK